MNTRTSDPASQLDILLVGAGIMSATLATLLKELDPSLTIEIHEVLGREAQESSNAWNNAGTGHAALCDGLGGVRAEQHVVKWGIAVAVGVPSFIPP